MTRWNGARLDVDAYLARIGYEGPRAPTAATLRELHRAHVCTISFENLDILFGQRIPIDVDSLQDKLVRRRRGGYCYEQNMLFAAVLDRIGYEVTGLAARIRMGSDKLRPASHGLLSVVVDGEPWLADVGFGGDGLLEPMPLADGVQVGQGAWTYRLDREAEVWVLRSRRADGWFDILSFTLDPQYPIDFAIKNYYTSTHPASPFVRRLVVQRAGDAERYTLVGCELTVTRPDGTSTNRRVPPAERPAVLRSLFGIELAPDDEKKIMSS